MRKFMIILATYGAISWGWELALFMMGQYEFSRFQTAVAVLITIICMLVIAAWYWNEDKHKK